MAGIQRRGDGYRILFRVGRRQYALGLGEVTKKEAGAKAEQVDYLLMRLKQGLIAIPPWSDPVEWAKYDGSPPPRPPEEASATAAPETTLGDLRDRYQAAHGNKLDALTLKGIKRHFGHLVRALGEGRRLDAITRADLQAYVDARLGQTWRGRPIGPQTAYKEIVSLRTAWNWARREGLVDGPCPCERLAYPKADEPEPYRSLAEVERASKGLDEAEAARLRESLYLTAAEVRSLLEHVRSTAAHPWIHPLVATAAYAGARRAELLRARVGDVDLEGGAIALRERKRSRVRKTTRRVPLSTELAEILRGWLAIHPGGPMLFGVAGVVGRSRKRGSGAVEVQPLTLGEVRHHFDHTLAGSRWEVVPGLHTLRHSFISALASAGVDQRVIDEFVGHSTEEQRRRYRHLYPSVQADAITRVFG